MKQPPALIGFDLDKTLIRSASWYRLNLAMGMSSEEDEALYRRGPEKVGELSYAEWMGELATIYQVKGQASKRAMDEVLFNYSILDGTVQAIETLKIRGYNLAIVTAGFEVVATDVANKLGIDVVRANVRLEFDDKDMFSKLILSSPNDRKFKAGTMLSLATEYNVDPQHTFYVADGDNDEEVFRATRGVQIAPDDSSHEPWKAAAINNGEVFALHDAQKAAEFTLTSIHELPALLDTVTGRTKNV